MVTLKNFTWVLPPITMEQEDSLNEIARIHASGLVRRFGVKPAQVARRRFDNVTFASSQDGLLERMRFFGPRAENVLSTFYPEGSTPPDHIVHVTCTGYVAPSAAQTLVSERLWSESTKITHAYHMGCYASLPAIRMAEGFALSGERRIDIVHTEMCGLHMDREKSAPEQLVVQSLFADGHIKYMVTADNSAHAGGGFRVLKICEQLIPDTRADMTWTPGDRAMQMTLSPEVPNHIRRHIRAFIERLARESQRDMAELLKNAVFALHPGGPKIIDGIRDALELSEPQILASRAVLRERGNMSSATLPHIWKELLDQRIASGTPVVSLAFGPGLTVFGGVFETL